MKIFHSFTNQELVTMLRSGSVGVLPTDTVYGLAARVSDPTAVERLYALKLREKKPGTTIAASIEQLYDLGIIPELLGMVEPYWPAPLSVVLPLDDKLDYLHQGLGESPFRVVADENLRQLLKQTGPLVTTSANQPGEPPARSISEAQAYFGDQVDFYVDGGHIGDREPSTIAKIVDHELKVVRPGAYILQERKQS